MFGHSQGDLTSLYGLSLCYKFYPRSSKPIASQLHHGPSLIPMLGRNGLSLQCKFGCDVGPRHVFIVMSNPDGLLTQYTFTAICLLVVYHAHDTPCFARGSLCSQCKFIALWSNPDLGSLVI